MDSLAERLKNMTPLQRAVFALKETQARLEALERKQAEPIALVGMACRFPGNAQDPASYWRLLCEGVDAIREIPSDRWDADRFYDPDPTVPGKMGSRWGGFIDGIDQFDNHFFGISDREAERTDPQQRILLELGWEALEDAGIPPSTLRGSRAGVFLGISSSEFGIILSGDLSNADAHTAAGTSLCIAANRISFALGMAGPSVALDTACSSSLVALHLACQNLRSGECDLALVGGTNLLLSPFGTINLTKAGFCAPDGRVHAFDASAAGYVRSEGAGIVVLKPLSAAQRNNDPIYAVIRGSAINQNGSCNGLTAPSRAAQEQVLREAYARARVTPAQIQYVETQGTGTRMGDTIEATALGTVLREGRASDSPCAIGSVKTNIGHTECASGMASLMKVALAIKHRQLPPSLHFQTPNPDIPFAHLGLRVQQKLETWPTSAHPRLAGVSAFGFGGSNAHVVLEEPPADAGAPPAANDQPQACLLPISARTEQALSDLARRYHAFLDADPPTWRDICYTAALRRDHHDCRLAILAASAQQARDALQAYLAGLPCSAVVHGRKPFGRSLKIAFIFDGRAEDWNSYGRLLLQATPGFQAALDRLDETVERIAGRHLTSMLQENSTDDHATWAHCALLGLHLALTAWWRAAGITPDVVVGQGVGELAAACAAGILSAEDALRIVASVDRDSRDMPAAEPQPRPAVLPFLSSVDGQAHAGPDLNAAHWMSCVTHPQTLATVIDALCQRPIDVGLALGPDTFLPRGASDPWSLVSTLPAGAADGSVLTVVGTLYAAGADLAWGPLAPAEGRCVHAPSYPWQRQRFAAPRGRWSTRAQAESDLEMGVEPATARVIRNRPDLTTPYVAPQTPLEKIIGEAWSAILRINGLGIHDNFFELGGDSLQATILLNRLREHLGEPIPAHVLFEVQTIGDLTCYIEREYPLAVERFADRGALDTLAPSAQATDDAGIPSIQRQPRDQQADQLLARLDDLSDEEVAALLRQTISDAEASHE